MTAVTGLTALTTPEDTDIYYVNQGATDYKATRAQIVASVQAELTALTASTSASITAIQDEYLKKTGGSMTGALTLSGSPSATGHAINKGYFDTQIATKADAADSALTGTPVAPTASVGTDSTQIATTAFVKAEIADTQFTYTPVTSATKALVESEVGRVAVNIAGACNITLPAISTLNNKLGAWYHIQDIGYNANATTQTITVTAGGSDSINNASTTATITTAGEDIYLYNDGSSSWYSRNVDIAASETAQGKVELATPAEAQALADTTRAVTAAGVSAILDNELYRYTECGG
jgi:hypothetical protein